MSYCTLCSHQEFEHAGRQGHCVRVGGCPCRKFRPKPEKVLVNEPWHGVGLMRPGDMVVLVNEPRHPLAGEAVIVTAVDADGQGFDFAIPEIRGHSPMRFAQYTVSHFDLDKIGLKPETKPGIVARTAAFADQMMENLKRNVARRKA
jgi:hypothetical protein